MADSLGTAAGGRIAFIYRQKEKRRKITTMMNEMATKRLTVIKKQIKIDENMEMHELDRRRNKVFRSNDEIKAFQKALIQRLSTVGQQGQESHGIRPLVNLGKYGGASIEQIKLESEKFKPIRDPQKIRMMKSQKLLQQGQQDGRIINFQPKLVGDLTERIMKLERRNSVDVRKLRHTYDVANLDDVTEADDPRLNLETPKDTLATTLIVRRRRLVRQPVQVQKTTLENYHRHSPHEDRTQRQASLPTQGILTDLNSSDKEGEGSNPGQRERLGSERRYFEWDYTKPLGPITKLKRGKKNIEDAAKFWKPNESLVLKPIHQRIVLPRIR